MGKIGTTINKTVVGIAATANCEFKAWIMIHIDQLHHLKISWHSFVWFFSYVDLITHQWQMTADG
jgi:hypothetical protein